jgi:hypothetical protein
MRFLSFFPEIHSSPKCGKCGKLAEKYSYVLVLCEALISVLLVCYWSSRPTGGEDVKVSGHFTPARANFAYNSTQKNYQIIRVQKFKITIHRTLRGKFAKHYSQIRSKEVLHDHCRYYYI